MSILRKRAARMGRRDEQRRHLRLGVTLYVGIAVLLGILAIKPMLTSTLASGETMTAEFDSSYKLRKYDSSVKVAGIEVGKVTKIEDTDRNTVIVTMKVDGDVVESLGSEPTARVEPRTVLGGRYAIEVEPGGGGDFTGEIPLENTSTPVELDAVLEALPQTAQESVQGIAGSTGPALENSRESLSKLLRQAPDVLAPGGRVVRAAQGNRPQQDLAELVTNLERTATVLTARDGQLDEIVSGLHETSVVLAGHRQALSATVRDLPTTLRQTRTNLTSLSGTFEQLGNTAEDLDPSVPGIVELVDELDPTLDEVKPLLADLKPLLRDARPAVRELVPVAKKGRGVLRDLRGPVLDRVNGPVVDFVLNPWVPQAKGYQGGAGGYLADHKFYEELAYMATNIDSISAGQDSRGSTLGFQAGVGLNSVDGLPFNVENIVKLALDQVGLGNDPNVLKGALRRAGVR